MPARSTMSVILIGGLSAPAFAGQLAPPAGPVTETGRFGPRTEISQDTTPGDADSTFRIDQPGSYYLPGDVIGEAGKKGIEVVANDVTIDLNGFELQGVPGSLEGITNDGVPISNVVIENGAIQDWGGRGIGGAFAALSFDSATLRGLSVMGNGANGAILGIDILVESCRFAGNALRGLDCISGVITGSQIIANGSEGINCSRGTISGCRIESNFGSGIQLAEGVVELCVVLDNTANGMSVGLGDIAIVDRCTVSRNGLTGIVAGGSGGTCIISHCTSTLNGQRGIAGLGETLVEACSANFNDDDGILVGAPSTVRSCEARGNVFDGIDILDRCLVVGCSVSGNGLNAVGSAGIRVNGVDNLIEQNFVSDNRTGIRVLGTNNVAVRNRAGNNLANYSFAAGNAFGPVIAVGGVGDISTALGPNDHPQANLSY